MEKNNSKEDANSMWFSITEPVQTDESIEKLVGTACIPTCIIVPLLVNKFGIKFFIVASFFGAGLSAACLFFISTSFENLVLSSVFEALSSTGIGLVFCTEYSGIAIAVSTMFSKVGVVIGNIVVGVFIDAHCMVPISVSCSLLFISGLLVFTLPKTGRATVK